VGRATGQLRRAGEKLTARLDEQKRLKSLLKAKLRGEVSQSYYADGNAEFDTAVRSLQEQIGSSHLKG